MTNNAARTHQFKIRLNDAERVEIERKARACCMSLSEYVRQCAVVGRIPKPPCEGEIVKLRIIRELGRIETNIIQLAKVEESAKGEGLDKWRAFTFRLADAVFVCKSNFAKNGGEVVEERLREVGQTVNKAAKAANAGQPWQGIFNSAAPELGRLLKELEQMTAAK